MGIERHRSIGSVACPGGITRSTAVSGSVPILKAVTCRTRRCQRALADASAVGIERNSIAPRTAARTGGVSGGKSKSNIMSFGLACRRTCAAIGIVGNGVGSCLPYSVERHITGRRIAAGDTTGCTGTCSPALESIAASRRRGKIDRCRSRAAVPLGIERGSSIGSITCARGIARSTAVSGRVPVLEAIVRRARCCQRALADASAVGIERNSIASRAAARPGGFGRRERKGRTMHFHLARGSTRSSIGIVGNGVGSRLPHSIECHVTSRRVAAGAATGCTGARTPAFETIAISCWRGKSDRCRCRAAVPLGIECGSSIGSITCARGIARSTAVSGRVPVLEAIVRRARCCQRALADASAVGIERNSIASRAAARPSRFSGGKRKSNVMGFDLTCRRTCTAVRIIADSISDRRVGAAVVVNGCVNQGAISIIS